MVDKEEEEELYLVSPPSAHLCHQYTGDPVSKLSELRELLSARPQLAPALMNRYCPIVAQQ